MIQIFAFLCRQTDLLAVAAKTKSAILVKKGQFMAPSDMSHVIQKITSQGNFNIMLKDRGTSFGYNNLISDFRPIPIMQKLGYPACFDATHSVKAPGSQNDFSGGQVEFIPVLSRASIASGCNATFIEAHPDPKNAKSDRMSPLSFEALDNLLVDIIPIYELMRNKQTT